MLATLPQVIHTYQNHTLDSTRWEHYRPRVGDIIISTSMRSGTTWTQEIVRQLIFLEQDVPQRHKILLGEVSPWLEVRWDPLDEVIGKLEAQTHRRFIKTHVALDGLPFFPQVKYIIVGRDARDVAMSLWNFYANFTEALYEIINNTPGRVGEPFPPPSRFQDFWRNWITQGWFPWESEGYPFWGNLHHTQSWWNYRHLENILFVNYNDLLADLKGEIRHIASFLDIPVSEEAIPVISQAVSLQTMRVNDERLNPAPAIVFKEGAKTFFFKGTNGRWKEALSPEELALYEEKAATALTPDCRAWLEQGRSAVITQP
jgi:aryl sulfotransferase